MKWTSGLLLAVAVGCASSSSRTATSTLPRSTRAPLPDDLVAHLASRADRELAPLPTWPFRSTDGKTLGAVEAVQAPTIRANGDADALEVPLGEAGRLECRLHRGRIDSAGSVYTTFAALSQKFAARVLRLVDVAVEAGQPMLFSAFTWFTPNFAGQKEVGNLQVGVAVHPRHSLVCTHDAIGYAASFQRIFKGLVASLETSGGAPRRTDARFASVDVLKLGDKAIGYTETLVWSREGGGAVIERRGSAIVPRAPQLGSADTLQLLRTDAAGFIESGHYVDAENAEISVSIDLVRQDGGSDYRATGRREGQRVDAHFSTARGLDSDLRQVGLVRDLLQAPPGAQVEVEEYDASLGPTRPYRTVYSRKQGAPDVVVGTSSNGLTSWFRPDTAGWSVHQEIVSSGVTLVSERAWVHGVP